MLVLVLTMDRRLRVEHWHVEHELPSANDGELTTKSHARQAELTARCSGLLRFCEPCVMLVQVELSNRKQLQPTKQAHMPKRLCLDGAHACRN